MGGYVEPITTIYGTIIPYCISLQQNSTDTLYIVCKLLRPRWGIVNLIMLI